MSTSATLGVTDIDVLALSVRDAESRRLVNEAITAYRGGALRAALISTWIAVAYDIIAKARELAGQGEAAPREFVHKLDNAIRANDKRKLQMFEAELLTKANSDLQLLAPHEYTGRRQRSHRHGHGADRVENSAGDRPASLSDLDHIRCRPRSWAGPLKAADWPNRMCSVETPGASAKATGAPPKAAASKAAPHRPSRLVIHPSA